MQINLGNDPQSLDDVAFAADRLNRFSEQLAVGHFNAREGNKQRSCTVVLSALGVAMMNCLHNMAKAVDVEYTDDDKEAFRQVLQDAMNTEVMKVLGRMPQNGN